MKLAELAAHTHARLERGAHNMEITGCAGLDEAQADHVTFLANPRYTPRVATTKASAIYVAEGVEVPDSIATLRAADPYLAYTRALRLFHPEPAVESFIHPTAVIASTARVHPTAHIGANVFIGERSTVGAHTHIHPNVTIYDDVIIGDDCRIHSGTSIREGTQLGSRVHLQNNVTLGSDGFGYAKDEQKAWLKIPQVGRVVIEDDVEIGAGTTVDRASTGESRIRRGAKIDNLVQIGHSCTVGEDALICAQTGLAGSSHIGARVILAGQVGIAGHLTVGDDAVLTAGSATSHDIPPGKVMSGKPAFDNRDWLRATAAFRRLGEMARASREMEKRVIAIEAMLRERDR